MTCNGVVLVTLYPGLVDSAKNISTCEVAKARGCGI